MIYFKKSDLVFISKLKLEIELTAKSYLDDALDKKSWVLEVETKNNGMIEQGLLIGARGEVRRFKQLNAIDALLREIFPSGIRFSVVL